MSKILYNISDLFVFWKLKKIFNGHLIVEDSKGKYHSFGDNKNFLKAKIKIIDPSFCYKILRKGSAGLGESYMRGEFESSDLTSLIELSARNIKTTYKFSGFFEFSFLKNFLNKIYLITQNQEVKKIYLYITI